VIVEAKNENLKGALGQCAAGMVAAQLFNEREGHPIPTLFGVATTGSLWQFLKLRGKTLTINRREYHIERIAKIVGILMWMIRIGEDVLVQSKLDTFSSPVDLRTILADVGHQKGYSEAGLFPQRLNVLPNVSNGDAEATREDA
jgi:hypothetical protein